jgi:phage terminase Nu1 subunit (DNA packaging protein)
MAGDRISASGLSKLIGVSQKSINYVVKNGIIDPPGADGLFDKETALYQYHSTRTDSNTFSEGKDATNVSYDDQFPTIAESKQKKAYYDALLSKINADRAQMDYDHSRKLLIDKKQLADKLKKIGVTIKNHIESVPTRYAAIISANILSSGEIDSKSVETIVRNCLDTEGRQLLSQIADEIGRL